MVECLASLAGHWELEDLIDFVGGNAEDMELDDLVECAVNKLETKYSKQSSKKIKEEYMATDKSDFLRADFYED